MIFCSPSGEGFMYWQILLFRFTHTLISELWVLAPFGINTKLVNHDQELGFSGEGWFSDALKTFQKNI